jgi:hypothetical protein
VLCFMRFGPAYGAPRDETTVVFVILVKIEQGKSLPKKSIYNLDSVSSLAIDIICV